MEKNGLKLMQLSETELSKKELKEIRGGAKCGCGCCYEGTAGGATFASNRNANNAEGLYSPDCENAWSGQDTIKKSDKLLSN